MGVEAVGKDWKQSPTLVWGKTGTTATLVQLEGVPRVRMETGGKALLTFPGAVRLMDSPGKGPSRSKRGPRADPLVTRHPLPSQMQ